MKFLFMPISIIGGLIAGFLGKKVFDQIWGLIDEEEPPGVHGSDGFLAGRGAPGTRVATQHLLNARAPISEP